MKFLTAVFKSKDEEKREITAFASTPNLDRDREIIRANAWQLDDFKKHPVLAVVHDYQKLWVAKVTEIIAKAEGLFFRAVFAKTAAANEVWELIKQTGIAAFSVGFLPIASENIPVKNLAAVEQKAALAAGLTLDGFVRIYTKVQLLEISVVSVPSNPAATLLSWKTLAKSTSIRDREEITISDLSPLDLIPKGDLARLRPEDIPDIDPEQVKSIMDERIEKTMATIKDRAIEIAKVHQMVETAIRNLVKERVELALAKFRGKVI